MKLMLTLLASIALVSADSHAGGFAKVLGTHGAVTLGGKPLQAGDTISEAGMLATDGTGFARIELLPSHSVMLLTPGTQLELQPPKTDGGHEIQEHSLLQGTARFQVQKTAPKAAKPAFVIRTKSATMGVRGTDFMSVANPLLGETEIVVFHGNVDFASAQDTADHKSVTDGHWGGIGGRFGAKTHDLIALPENVLQAFDRQTAEVSK